MNSGALSQNRVGANTVSPVLATKYDADRYFPILTNLKRKNKLNLSIYLALLYGSTRPLNNCLSYEQHLPNLAELG